jgi:hypothetical protein
MFIVLLSYVSYVFYFFICSTSKNNNSFTWFCSTSFSESEKCFDFDILLSGFKSSDVQHVFLNKKQQKFAVSGLTNALHIQQKNCKTGKNEVALALKNDIILVKDVQLEYHTQKGIVTRLVLKYVGGKLKKFLCYTDLWCVEQTY